MTSPPPSSNESQQPADNGPSSQLGFELPEAPHVGGKRVGLVVAGVLLLLAAAFAAGYLPKRNERAALVQRSDAASNQLVRVAVVHPKLLRADLKITLPGSIQPLAEAALYPQTNGYVKRFLVDIGDKVTEGQLLAEIATPELDQELDQARAALLQSQASFGQAKANRDYANTSLQRYTVLRPSGVASQQELDQKSSEALVAEANVTAAEAAVAVQQANIRRLQQVKRFAQVVAPFAGTIVSRSVDKGTLVTSGNSTQLFRLVATDPVRVFVQVPQDVAPSVKVGGSAQVSLREYPNRTFEGIINRTSGALDPATRSLNTEVRVPNPNNELLAGMYSEVSLTLSRPHDVYELPGTALYNDAQGMRVATVDARGDIHFVPIVVERDMGTTLQIASRLSEDDQVIMLANASFSEGTRVAIEQAPAKPNK